MRYTYKRENFFGDGKYNRTMIAGIVILTLSIMMAAQTKLAALMFGVIGICVLMVGVMAALSQKRKNLEYRREMMTKGYMCHGEIVDAGGRFYSTREYTGHRDKNNVRESYLLWKSNWWIEVQYYDEHLGIMKKFRAQNMNKNGKLYRMIGKAVEVYKYNDFVYIHIPY